jgi:hypothetical protein
MPFFTFQSPDSEPCHLMLKAFRSHHPGAGSDGSDCSLRFPDTVSDVHRLPPRLLFRTGAPSAAPEGER